MSAERILLMEVPIGTGFIPDRYVQETGRLTYEWSNAEQMTRVWWTPKEAPDAAD